MTSIVKIGFLFSLMATASLTAAADGDPETFRGVDITALKGRFAKVLRTVQKPFYLYHWRSSPDLVNSVEAQQDPRGTAFMILQNEAPLFISGLEAPGRTNGNMYGGGLYTSVDPVATEGFGSGSPDRFAVLAIQVPVGFRVLDLNAEWNSGVSASSVWGAVKSLLSREESRVIAVLNAFQCDPSRTSPDSLLASNLSKPCADLIAHVLGSLKVDGFFYSYNATKFGVCKTSEDREFALVFTSARWLSLPGADARLYTSKTTADVEERRVIESVFAYSRTMDKVPFDPDYLDILGLFEARGLVTPQRMVEIRRTSYSQDSSICAADEGCVSKVTLKSYPDINGKAVTVGEIKLQRSDFASYLMERFPDRFLPQNFYHTHWADLQGQATLPDTESWIKDNIFRCGTTDPLTP